MNALIKMLEVAVDFTVMVTTLMAIMGFWASLVYGIYINL